MTYRAGVVGCGRVGCAFDDDPRRGYVSTHAGAYSRTPGVNLVALCDLNQELLDRYAEKFNVPGRYTDLERMLGAERLDILSVCTWNHTHRECVERAVDAGVKAVFCEKPIAESLGSADVMVQKCAERGVVLMIDHQRRFDRLHQDVAAFLKAGKLGRIQQVTCYYTAGVANTGSHLFDLLRFFLGEVEWAAATYSRNHSGHLSDPNVDGWLQFRNGPLVSIQSCDVNDYTIFEVEILGTKGRLGVTSHGFDIRFETVSASTRFTGYRELCPATPPVQADGPREFMLQGVAHLVDCLERGTLPVCSGEDGRGALEIVCALRESAQADGVRVQVPLTSSSITVRSR